MGNEDNEFLRVPALRLARRGETLTADDVAKRVRERSDGLLVLLGHLRATDPAAARDLAGRLARALLALVREDGGNDEAPGA